MATEVCWYIEDWGSTLGTSGENGWIKGTNTKLSTGAGSFLDKDTYLDSNGTINKICMNTSPKILPSKYGSQYHRFDGTNTVFFTKMSMKSDGSLAAWAVFDAWAGAQVQVQVYLTSETSTSYEAIVKTLNLGAGTIITNGTMTLWYDSNGSWNVACSCTSNEGSARSGTLSWAGVGYGTTYPLAASICIQPLGGSAQLFYSRWQYSIPTLPTTGSWYIEDWGSTFGTSGTQGTDYPWQAVFDERDFTYGPRWGEGDSALIGFWGDRDWMANEKLQWAGFWQKEKITGNQYHIIALGTSGFSTVCRNMFRLALGTAESGVYPRYYLDIEQSDSGKTHLTRIYKSYPNGTMAVVVSTLGTSYWANSNIEVYIYNRANGTFNWALVGTRDAMPFAEHGTYANAGFYSGGTGASPCIVGWGASPLFYSKFHSNNLDIPADPYIKWVTSWGTTGWAMGGMPSSIQWGWKLDNTQESDYTSGQPIWLRGNARIITLSSPLFTGDYSQQNVYVTPGISGTLIFPDGTTLYGVITSYTTQYSAYGTTANVVFEETYKELT